MLGCKMLQTSLPHNQAISMLVNKQLLCNAVQVACTSFCSKCFVQFLELRYKFFLHKHRPRDVVLRDTYVLRSSDNKNQEAFSRENANRGDVLGRVGGSLYFTVTS
jgi:hypothetical protein